MFAGKRNFLVAFFQAVLRLDCESDSMALTDTAIKLAKVGNVDRKRPDDRGLYLLVTASGPKLWRPKYRIDGKEKQLAFGSCPEAGLKEARAWRDAARTAAQAGTDPAVAKREARIARQLAAGNT